MENTLIIKTGAAGDVVRTTSLLNVLEGNIFWVTNPEYQSLLPEDVPLLNSLSLPEAFQSLKKIRFSRVISLEEDNDCARLASEVRTSQLTGIYLDKGKISYTDDSAGLFDMSRISRFKKMEADRIKKENTLSYQHLVFRMLGKQFNGEPYRIFTDHSITCNDELIGIEKRAGRQWPNKHWTGYNRLIEKLRGQQCTVDVLEQRDDIRDYMRDIARCNYIISGDTLAMHIALAYKKNCTAIFNCTSPQEIYDYGLLKKVVSPLLPKYFYKTSFDEAAIECITVAEVWSTIPLGVK